MEFLVYFALGFVQKSRVNHLDILDEKIKPIDLVARVFPRFRQLRWFYPLAFNGIFLSSDWLS